MVSIEVPSDVQGGAFDVTVTFSEPVTGFIQSELAVTGTSGASITTWAPQTGGTDYKATITPTRTGTAIFNVAADVAEDAVDNLNAAATQQRVTVDRTPPTVSIEVPSADQGGAFDVTVKFSESVTGFIQSELVVTGTSGASITTWTPQTGGTDYKATITPTQTGTAIFNVAAGVAEDAVDNLNTAATQQRVTVDMERPMVSIEVPSDVQGGAFDVTVTFSEPVTGFIQSELAVTGTSGASITTWTPQTGGTDYKATITPTQTGTAIFNVAANVATDAVENLNTAATQQRVTVDRTRPTVSIEVPSDVQGGVFDVTVVFSESVTGFVQAELVVSGTSGASITTWAPQDGGTDYIATITPTGTGTAIFNVAANVAEDAGKNPNTVATQQTVNVDITRPTVSIEVPSADQGGAFDVTVTFSESVTGFIQSELVVSGTSGASITTWAPQTGGTDYKATITPTRTGTAIFNVAANVAEDAAENPNTAATEQTGNVDMTRPTVSIDVPSDVQYGAFTITITFSEVVSGFAAADIVLSGDASDSVTVSGTGSTYTATITPGVNSDGDVVFEVPADSAQDLATNVNTASQSHSVSVAPSWIPDPNLRATVREALGLAEGEDFSQTDMLGLIVLDGLQREITDITGLEYATELIELSLNDNLIDDISPLVALTELRILSLERNAIDDIGADDDIGPLAALTQLTELSLNENAIEDISPLAALAALTELRILSLDQNVIEDISPLAALAALTELRILSLDQNVIDDISSLADLTQLTALSLNENAIEDITPLESLTQLTELSLNENAIEDIIPLELLTQLKILHLEHNQISDLFPLVALVNLEVLTLTGNPIDDTTPLIGIARNIDADQPTPALIPDEALAEALREIFDLSAEEHITYADMRNLTTLEAPDSDISDLTGLEHATALTTLDLRNNAINDVAPLQGLTQLTTLDLSLNSISDITPLAGLTALTELSLEENRIADIGPLIGLENLELLRLAENPIADARPLAGLTDLDIDIELTAYLVEFPDEGLAAAVRASLELAPSESINSTSLQSLTTLAANSRQISDLTGLEHATALTTLDLRNNAIRDVAPLAGLVNLQTLRLTGNPIRDVSALADLTAAIEADVVVPGVIADAALAAAIRNSLGLPPGTRILATTLQNLTTLDAQSDEITTLTGLEHATALTTLYITSNAITDISSLQGLTHLKTLAINGGSITDITPLQALTHLTILVLSGGEISDITPLQKLTHLTILVLSDNAILDITPLSGLKSLKVLDLGGNSINSIDALKGMTALTTLNLSANRISSIVSLQGMTGLTTLDLGGNSINSIAALQGLTGLRTLNLEGNAISEIAALRALTLLRTLNLEGNSINSIAVLQGLTGLRTLDLAGNTLSSIDGLQGVTALTTLDLGANALSDIRRLQGLTALKRLYLSSNNISDVAPLSGLLNLELLRLAENPIMDTSPLFPLVTEHKLRDVDIEISQWAPWDVNRDGSVDATDSALITAAMGQTGEAIANLLTDINGDGIVDRADLLLVTEHFSTNNAGAPSSEAILALLGSSTLKSLDRTTLEAELNGLLAESDGSPKYRRAIAMLQSFLVALRPDKTRLLANYPNPFNPETWIPYQLAAAGDVAFVIYDARGAVVRRLAVGHQKAGYYVERNRAAYWDGRNAVGERVASGIYFYELRADNRSLLRKMLILK